MIASDLIAAALYAACIVAFLVLVRTTTLGQSSYDPGPAKGGKPYPFFDRHSLFHLAGCALACLFALWLGVHWLVALALTVTGGIAYEAVNGSLDHRGSWYDVVWDTMGALLAVGLFGSVLEAQDTTRPLIDSTRTGSGNAPLFMIVLGVIVLVGGALLVYFVNRKDDGSKAGGPEGAV